MRHRFKVQTDYVIRFYRNQYVVEAHLTQFCLTAILHYEQYVGMLYV